LREAQKPVGRKGLQRKSFLPPGGKKIEAKSPVCGVLRRKCAKIPNRSEIII
jgi:hypothetical protein